MKKRVALFIITLCVMICVLGLGLLFASARLSQYAGAETNGRQVSHKYGKTGSFLLIAGGAGGLISAAVYRSKAL